MVGDGPVEEVVDFGGRHVGKFICAIGGALYYRWTEC